MRFHRVSVFRGSRRGGLFPTPGIYNRPLEQNRLARLWKRLHRFLLIRHEHRIASPRRIDQLDIGLEELGLTLLAVRAIGDRLSSEPDAPGVYNPGDVVICSGPDVAHDRLEDLLDSSDAAENA
ncbi:MAG: hypothetical protein ACPGRZ_04830 [Alphaproteobacteria bacterium]